MAKLRVHAFSISLDGFAAGPGQDAGHPLGHGGEALHEWIFATAYGRKMTGASGGGTGTDDALLRAGDAGIGATIMGRNMFGPIRGPWPDDSWRGWWGPTPPYRHDVFVLTHHARAPLSMDGGTTFHFVTAGPRAALELATTAASGLDVRLGGGPGTIAQFLELGLVDELHLALVPVLLGSGQRLFADGWNAAGYVCRQVTASGSLVHVRLVRR